MIRFLRCLLRVILGFAAGFAGAVEITHGPDVIAEPTGAVIRWTTDVESGSRVRYGRNPERLDRRADGAVGKEHVVEVRGLDPETVYHYTAGTARVPLVTNSFTTPGLVRPTGGRVADNPAGAFGETQTNASPAMAARPPPARVSWGTLRSLQDHFDRHGADFAARDPEDYAAKAWLFLVRAKTEGLPAKRDDSGVVRVYDPRSGAFAAYNRDGTTRTYFKPGRRDYFAGQPGDHVDLKKLDRFQPPR
jgi:hypothetical protein